MNFSIPSVPRPVRATFRDGEYLVEIRPARVFDELIIYQRRPGSRFFPWKKCVSYLFSIVAAEYAMDTGASLLEDDALTRIAEHAIDNYLNKNEMAAARANQREKQIRHFENKED